MARFEKTETARLEKAPKERFGKLTGGFRQMGDGYFMLTRALEAFEGFKEKSADLRSRGVLTSSLERLLTQAEERELGTLYRLMKGLDEIYERYRPE